MTDRLKMLAETLRQKDGEQNHTCDICSREVFSGERVCTRCFAALPHIREGCPLCGRAVGEAGLCLDCKERPLAVDLARSAFVHTGEAARLVLRFKDGERYLYRTLCDLLLPLPPELAADAVVCVPMTEKSRKKRGYNQSELLAREISRRCGLPFLNVLQKTRDSLPQKTLGRREREENLKGCFKVIDRAAVKGKRLLLLDDTMTTGATASELGTALKHAGAVKVSLLTVTSVPRKNPFGIPPKEKPLFKLFQRHR